MNKYLFLLLTSILAISFSFGQTIIYQQNFDTDFASDGLLGNTPTAGWISSLNPSNCGTNYWGVYSTGLYPINSRSLMVTGVDDICNFYPGQYFLYITVLNTHQVYTTVDATNFENITLDFNWKCGGEIFNGTYYDYGRVVYRPGTSGPWQILTTGGNDGLGRYAGQINTQSQNLTLPSSIEDGVFQIGYRWIQDNDFGNLDGFVIDDIVVRGTPLSSCLAGTASPTYQYVPTNGTANMTLSGYTGSTIQWQVSPNGTSGWANASSGIGANTASYTTASLADGTYYYRAVVTDGACSDESNVIEVVVAANPVYCSGAGIGNATFNNHLEAVKFHEWTDPTIGGTNAYVTNNYLDYTDTTTYGYATVVAGQYHHLNAVLRARGSGTSSTTFAYWIDWNGDGVFTNTSFAASGERMDNINYTSNIGNSYAAYFTIPATSNGMVRVRMRVVTGNQGTLDPCTSYSGSQTKDFMVKILPSIGNQVCNGVNGSGNNVLINSTSDKVNISRVQVNGPSGTILDNNSNFFGIQSGGSTTMYNYSNMMGAFSNGLVFEEGQNYTVNVEHSGYTAAAGLFIDWNGDGDFQDTDEIINVILDPSLNPFVFNFTAPASVVDGQQVAMRVRLQYENFQGEAASMSGCNNISGGVNSYSEVEDYRATLKEATTLPVSWLNVSATCLEKTIEFDWSTATEINNDYFEVYASSDGIDFDIVGEVSGAGNSKQINEYTFIIEKQQNYKYFKIKQTDFDGQFEFSKIVTANCADYSDKNELEIYPNPFNGSNFTINYSDGNRDLIVEIYDLTGKLIATPKLNYTSNLIQVSLGEPLTKGSYLVKLFNEKGYISTEKLLTK